MTGGGGDLPQMQPAVNGGEFLLSLLQRPSHQFQTPPQPPPQSNSQLPIPIPITHSQQNLLQQRIQQQQQQQQQSLALDPAVAAVGPSISFSQSVWQSNGGDVLTSPPWPHNFSPPLLPGFSQNHYDLAASQFQGNQQIVLGEGTRLLGFPRVNNMIHNRVQPNQQQQQQQEQKLQFGSFRSDTQSDALLNSKVNAAKQLELGLSLMKLNGLENNRKIDQQLNSNLRTVDLRDHDRIWGEQLHGGNPRPHQNGVPPPGFSNKPRGGGNWNYTNGRRDVGHNVNKEKGNQGQLSERNGFFSNEEKIRRNGDYHSRDLGLTGQLDHPGPPAGSTLFSVPAAGIEQSLLNDDAEDGKDEGLEFYEVGEELVGSLLLEGESDVKYGKKINRHFHEKESRSGNRGQRTLTQRMRMHKRFMECRRDIDMLNAPFLAIYESLIPPEEEKLKQKQLLTLLEKLVTKEWPEAQLFLYGSCANSFGFLKSDIDVCLTFQDPYIDKSEVLLTLANILESDNLQNVQALTRARVPIVKLMDPVTEISCDICINNVLAVVNTKLLSDYSQIDVRLRQLAFIVKHWAKTRKVNETYHGTLSSYAYVLMCIHFLQQRRPPILPCLQERKATYVVNVDGIECAYDDQVEKLRGFGSPNQETIAQLVWAFFNYWAYHHDYANAVISIRRGTTISKREKGWTTRVGNDRHLICIEDPFEVSHDLGRVVDKFSIKVLREEFERAADIMQYAPNPCVALFEPYFPSY